MIKPVTPPPFERGTYTRIAKRLGVTRQMVGRVAHGTAVSERVKAALVNEERRQFGKNQ